MAERTSNESQRSKSTQLSASPRESQESATSQRSVLTLTELPTVTGSDFRDGSTAAHRQRQRSRNKNPQGLLHRIAKVPNAHQASCCDRLLIQCLEFRTGTQDLARALSNLGYRPYHSSEIVKNGKRDMELLLEALVLRRSETEEHVPYTQEEFDRIWGKYDALVDLPGYAFVDEVVTFYPHTQFILTDRNVDEWLRDMQATVFAQLSSWTGFVRSIYDRRQARPQRRLMREWARGFCGLKFGTDAREAYIDHVKHCLKIIPKERLLILHSGEDDWQDLCEFLGKEVPDFPYPGPSQASEWSTKTTWWSQAERYWSEWLTWPGSLVVCSVLLAAMSAFLVELFQTHF